MNEFRQHIPAFVDIPTPDPISFNTTEELINLPTVLRYKKKDFSHFAVNENRLLVISDEGYHWWVVGYLKHPEQVDLPKWEGPKRRKNEDSK